MHDLPRLQEVKVGEQFSLCALGSLQVMEMVSEPCVPGREHR